jgi:hypothetical protein
VFVTLFLGTFTKLRKATISFVPVRPSVCPHGTTRLPFDESDYESDRRIFRKSVEIIQVS